MTGLAEQPENPRARPLGRRRGHLTNAFSLSRSRPRSNSRCPSSRSQQPGEARVALKFVGPLGGFGEQPGDELVGSQAFAFGREIRDDAVSQRRRRQRGDIFARSVRPAVQQRTGFRALQEVLHRPRASAENEGFRQPRRRFGFADARLPHQRQSIPGHMIGQRHPPRQRLAAQQRGLFTRLRGDVFNLAPCYLTSDAQVDRMINILAESIEAVLGK